MPTARQTIKMKVQKGTPLPELKSKASGDGYTKVKTTIKAKIHKRQPK